MTNNLLRGMKDGELPARQHFSQSDLARKVCLNGHAYRSVKTFEDGTRACLDCVQELFRAIHSEKRAAQLLFSQTSGGMSQHFFLRAQGLGREWFDRLFPDAIPQFPAERFLYLSVVFFLRSGEDKEKICSYETLFKFISFITLKRGEEEKKIIENFFDIP